MAGSLTRHEPRARCSGEGCTLEELRLARRQEEREAIRKARAAIAR